MAVLAPIPSASVSTATMRNPGWRVKTRKAKRTSCRIIFVYTIQDRVGVEEKIQRTQSALSAEDSSRKINSALSRIVFADQSGFGGADRCPETGFSQLGGGAAGARVN